MDQHLSKALPGRLGLTLAANLQDGEALLAQLHFNTGEALVATDRRVLVLKAGWLQDAGPFGAKCIAYPYHAITSVEHRQGPLGGHVQLLVPGVLENAPHNSIVGPGRNNARENVVTYQQRAHRDAVNTLVAIIQDRVQQARTPAVVSAPAQGTASIADEILKLAQLRDQGVLNDAEFSAAKQRLLQA